MELLITVAVIGAIAHHNQYKIFSTLCQVGRGYKSGFGLRRSPSGVTFCQLTRTHPPWYNREKQEEEENTPHGSH